MVVLSAVVVLSAGCIGFGTDSPDDPSEQPDEEPDAEEEESDDAETTDDGPEQSEDDDEDPNEHDSTDPPESSSEDEADESPTDGSDDGEETDDASSEEGADDEDAPDDTDDTDAPDDTTDDSDTTDNSEADDAPNDDDRDVPAEDDEDASSENGDDDAPPEDEEPVYTLTVEATSPVTLERTWEDASTTREPTDGTVEFPVIEGSYTLSADGYYDIHEELALQIDSDTTVTLQSEDGADVEVTVVDAETGEGIEGAEIGGVCNWYYSSGDAYVTGETDADGVATAHAGLSPTDCDTTVSAEGYESENLTLSVPEDDGLTVELEPEVPETNRLTVEVTDAETGEPIEGADVEAYGADGDPDDTRDLQYAAETNEDGIAEMEVQAAMNYGITVEAAGYETGHGEVSLDREASIELTPEGNGDG